MTYTDSHFDEMTLLLYLDAQVEPDRARAIAAHLNFCEQCRRLHDALRAESLLLHTSLQEADESIPARLLEASQTEDVPWSWIAGLGFAAAGAYTLWIGVVEPLLEPFSQTGMDERNLLAMLFFNGVFWKGWEDVWNMIQVLAALTMFGLLARAFRRRGSGGISTVAVVFGALLALLLLPSSAAAAEIVKAKDAYTLPAGQTVENDLIVFGAMSVRIDGNVNGDLIVFSQTLTVTGKVAGDVIAFAQRVRLEGDVGGNIRCFTNSLDLDGSVARNATVFAEDVSLNSKGQLSGSLYSFSGHLALEGRIGRDLTAFFENGLLNGFVGGNSLLGGKNLNVGSSAELRGKAKFRGRNQPNVSPQAKLAAGPLEIEITRERPRYAEPRFYWHKTLSWGAAFVFAALLGLLMPDFLRDAVRSSSRYGPAFGLGALALVATPILAIIACITVVGLAVGIAALLVYVIALYAAQVFVAAWIGQRLIGDWGDAYPALLGRLALGLLILRVLWNIPSAYVSFLVGLVVLLWGLGAMTLAITRRIRPSEAAPAV